MGGMDEEKKKYFNTIQRQIMDRIAKKDTVNKSPELAGLQLQEIYIEIKNRLELKKKELQRNPIKIFSKQQQMEIKKIIDNRYNQSAGLLNLNQKRQSWYRVIYYMARYYNLQFKQIQQLNLQQCNISIDNIQQLSKHDWVKLEFLWLWGNQLDDSCVKKMVQHKLWPNLKMLRLAHNKISGDSLLQFFGPNFPNLNTFYFAKNRNTQIKGLKAFFQSATDILRILQISDCMIASNGVKLLVKSSFPMLEELKAERCSIGNEGIKYLVKGYWPDLKKISLNGNFLKGLPTIHLSMSGWQNNFSKLNERQQNKYMQPIACLQLVASCWNETQVFFDTDNYSLKQEVVEVLEKRFQLF